MTKLDEITAALHADSPPRNIRAEAQLPFTGLHTVKRRQAMRVFLRARGDATQRDKRAKQNESELRRNRNEPTQFSRANENVCFAHD
ncbi:MAG: hypothetical protein AB7G24_09060 [Novosphingobium sp.]